MSDLCFRAADEVPNGRHVARAVFRDASAYNGTPQAAMLNENKAAGRGPTRSVRAAQWAKTTNTAGPPPRATVTHVGPGTRIGRGSLGAVIRRLTSAMK